MPPVHRSCGIKHTPMSSCPSIADSSRSAGVIDEACGIKDGAGMSQAIAELRGVKKTYYKPDGSILVEAVGPGEKGLDLKIAGGQYVAIMGASGSGKSTLMNILGCLDRPTGGMYLLDGRDTAAMGDEELSQFR